MRIKTYSAIEMLQMPIGHITLNNTCVGIIATIISVRYYNNGNIRICHTRGKLIACQTECSMTQNLIGRQLTYNTEHDYKDSQSKRYLII